MATLLYQSRVAIQNNSNREYQSRVSATRVSTEQKCYLAFFSKVLNSPTLLNTSHSSIHGLLIIAHIPEDVGSAQKVSPHSHSFAGNRFGIGLDSLPRGQCDSLSLSRGGSRLTFTFKRRFNCQKCQHAFCANQWMEETGYCVCVFCILYFNSLLFVI